MDILSSPLDQEFLTFLKFQNEDLWIFQLLHACIWHCATTLSLLQFQTKLCALTHPFTAASVADVAYGRFGSVLAYSADKTNKKVMPEGQTIGKARLIKSIAWSGFSDHKGRHDSMNLRTRAAQCIDKEILISKNGYIDIDIEIDKRTYE